jgi:molecular chaperone GrpE
MVFAGGAREGKMTDKRPRKEMKETKAKNLKQEGGAEANERDAPGVSGDSARDERDSGESGAPDGQTSQTGQAGPTGRTEDAGQTAQTADEPKEDESARYMRLAADFQNYKKRTEKEKSDIYAYANEKFAADLLDVIDNFERAIAQDATTGADGQFIEGMRLIMEQLVNVLERNDVKEINALGAAFDPNLHHAVQMEESAEHDSGNVTQVIQKGYMIKEKVLRPSTVIVAK